MYIISLKLYLQINKIFEDSLFKKVKAIHVSNILWQVVVYFYSMVGKSKLDFDICRYVQHCKIWQALVMISRYMTLIYTE